MAGGIIDTGMGYQRSALSGMARTSQQEQQRLEGNQQMAVQQKTGEINTAVSALSMIGMLAIMA